VLQLTAAAPSKFPLLMSSTIRIIRRAVCLVALSSRSKALGV
jgi:hypothetical protein